MAVLLWCSDNIVPLWLPKVQGYDIMMDVGTIFHSLSSLFPFIPVRQLTAFSLQPGAETGILDQVQNNKLTSSKQTPKVPNSKDSQMISYLAKWPDLCGLDISSFSTHWWLSNWKNSWISCCRPWSLFLQNFDVPSSRWRNLKVAMSLS